jgi:hypothetical protein
LTKSAALLLVAVLLIALAWSVLGVFHAGFEDSRSYPAFSSLSKDPDGTSVLFESLKRLVPATERSYLPVESTRGPVRTMLLLGAHPEQLRENGVLDCRGLESLARRGNRIVLALKPKLHTNLSVDPSVETVWGVQIRGGGETRFRAGEDWTVVRGDREHAEVIERSFGPGSLVLVASNALFTNGALAGKADTTLLSWIIGPTDSIVFDETHLGIVEAGSIMGLLRAFHLQGLLLGLLLPFALLAWRYSTSFPPVQRSEPSSHIEGRRSFSGLVALLRRNLRAADLASACWQEWLKGAVRPLPPARQAQVEQQLVHAGAQPLRTLRNIYEILHRKGTD